MSDLVDPDVLEEIARLEKAGSFNLARLLRDSSEINLDAVAGMAVVPAKYLRYLVNSPLYQQLRMQYDERSPQERERKEHTREFIARLMELHQREIDRNVVEFTIDGQIVKMSQGDLRRSMEKRVKDIKERIEILQASGGNPEELEQLQNLAQKYEPMIENLRKGKASAKTMEVAQDFVREDPELAEMLKSNSQNSANAGRRTSFANEHFGDQPSLLKASWNKTASGEATTTSPVPASPPAPDRPKNPDAVFDAANF